MNDFVKRLARLPADRRAQFLALLREETDGPAVGPVPVPCERGASGPLSFGQESLWVVSTLAPNQPVYNQPICFRLTGELDVAALRQALATAVARHEMLRTGIAEGPDGLVQTTHSRVPVELPVIDVPGEDIIGRRVAADERARELSRALFALGRPPLWRAALLRVAPDEHVFLFVVHHIVYDGSSLGVLLTELTDLYGAAVAGTSHTAVEPNGEIGRLEYGDYVLWQREWLTGENLTALTTYWRDTLARAPILELPTDRSRPAELSYRGGLLRRIVSLGGPDEIGRLARSMSTTANIVCTAAFLALMHRYTGAEDIVIGTPTANRESVEVESVFGYFVNMLPLRVAVSGELSFRELTTRVGDVVQGALAHGSLPFTKLLEAVQPVRDPSRSPIFQVSFVTHTVDQSFAPPGLRAERLQVDLGTTRFDLGWDANVRADDLELIVNYSTDLFDEETIETLIGLYANVVRAVAKDPELALARIPLLADAQREMLLTRWNGSVREVAPTTIPELFARQVARREDAVAVVVDGEEVSYAALERRANQLARLLRDAGAAPGQHVALCLPRRADLIVAMLAVLKAGAAYVPLDPDHPRGRLVTILDDCAPVAVVTTGPAAANLPELAVPVVRLDADLDRLAAAPPTALPPSAGPEDLAYVLYTSGSTGTPKGVLIEHHAVVNFIAAMQETFELTEADRVLGFAAVTFDVSVFEIFSALLTGGRLYLATEDERLDVDRLQELLVRSEITVTDLPPPIMALLEPERLPALRIVFAGLEAFPGELVNRWSPGRRFFNGYGPTECTVTMTVHECTGHWDSSPPIGLPIANHVAHVVDATGELVPIGVPGELTIGGAGLARGYLNRPELTAERFINDPFGTSRGGRLYRTGDLVRRQRDGALVFLGRVDNQVKIRGLRIELGEIESMLSRHPEVGQVSVDVRLDEHGDKHLVCYVAGRTAPPQPTKLREWLADQLPAYMVPTQYVLLSALPLTHSGKVDRRQLPAPPEFSRDPDGPIEYASETERTLAVDIVAPVLRLTPDLVPPDRNFFEMGGHSLGAARVLARIRSQFSVEISLADFFRAPTVRELAALIDKRRPPAGEDELLALLESLTDDEAAALLAAESGGAGR